MKNKQIRTILRFTKNTLLFLIGIIIGINLGKLLGIGIWMLINRFNILEILEKIGDFITFV